MAEIEAAPHLNGGIKVNIQQLKDNHDSQNELYIQSKNDLFTQGQINELEWVNIAETRVQSLYSDISAITQEEIDATADYIEVTDCFVSFFDDVILECTIVTDKRKEVEGKILELCKKALGKPTEEVTRDYDQEHVVCGLIDALILYEMPMQLRGSVMKAAMLDETNPLRFGQTFYEDFCTKYPEQADVQLLQYLRCEFSLRQELTKGDPGTASEIATRLMNMPINDSERYLLVSMVMFLNGMVEDATRILEIGISNFPDNQRLLVAKASL